MIELVFWRAAAAVAGWVWIYAWSSDLAFGVLVVAGVVAAAIAANREAQQCA